MFARWLCGWVGACLSIGEPARVSKTPLEISVEIPNADFISKSGKAQTDRNVGGSLQRRQLLRRGGECGSSTPTGVATAAYVPVLTQGERERESSTELKRQKERSTLIVVGVCLLNWS
jgi:hypothetical protein